MRKNVLKLRRIYLETQRLRENLIRRLSDLLEMAQVEMEHADPVTKPEWLRLIGYISSTLNAIMKSYDEVRIDEELQRLKEIIERAEEIEKKSSR